MSIGIFADKQLLIDDAINAYKHGGFTLGYLILIFLK
jgi:hypothetical protein